MSHYIFLLEFLPRILAYSREPHAKQNSREEAQQKQKPCKVFHGLILTRLWSQGRKGGAFDENHRFSGMQYVFGYNCVGCGNLPDSQKILWWLGAWQFSGGF